MARTTLIFGSLLILLGIIPYAAISTHPPTALIPAGIGVVFIVLGALAFKPSLRKHTMHAAAALALLGFFATAPAWWKIVHLLAGQSVSRPAAVISQSIMALLCAAFVALCVRSFIEARRNPAGPLPR